jgi:predicted transcriptional regulator
MIQETSRLSYEEEKAKGLSERHRAVLEALQNGEKTDQEIKQFLGVSDPNFVRPRRFELAKEGLVEAGIKRRCSVTGKTSLVWRLSLRHCIQQELTF